MLEKQTTVIAFLAALFASILTIGLSSQFSGIGTNGDGYKSNAQLIEELDNLTERLGGETQARRELEQKLESLALSITPLPISQTTQHAPTVTAEDQSPNELLEDNARAEQARAFREQIQVSRGSNPRKQHLLQNGFAEDEANWVLQAESQVQLDSLQAQYDARRKQALRQQAEGTLQKSQAQQLQEALGVDYYERYLEANGLPTSVGVSSVLEGSPGFNSGLKAGDRILSYNGNRVFNIRELNQMTILGDQGQSVLLEIERNGNPQQITIPRGPIGITSRRGRF